MTDKCFNTTVKRVRLGGKSRMGKWMWFLVLYNMHASNMVTIAPTHYLTTNDAIIESNVTCVWMFLCDEFALTCKGDNIYHIWLCWIRPHGTSGCTSYSPMNISLMVGPEFAPLKASTMRILFRPFEIPTALSHRPKRPTQPETENTLNHSPLLPSKANVLTDRVLPIV